MLRNTSGNTATPGTRRREMVTRFSLDSDEDGLQIFIQRMRAGGRGKRDKDCYRGGPSLTWRYTCSP